MGNLGVWRQVWLLMHITVYHKKSECMFVSVDTVMAPPGRLGYACRSRLLSTRSFQPYEVPRWNLRKAKPSKLIL
jgi:hypothetical protein